MGTPSHGLPQTFQGLWAVAIGLAGMKCIGEVTVHFRLELNTLGVLDVPTDEKLMDWGRANMWAVPRRPRTYIYCRCAQGVGGEV
jgi:hypothetical protein